MHPLRSRRLLHNTPVQDISIDVYGRQAKENAAAAVSSNAPSADAVADEEEADDMDALLSV